MFFKILSVFIVIPLVELAILVKTGTIIGFWYTMLIVIITGIAGAALARYQGIVVLSRLQREINSGVLPGDEMLDALFILAGGLVLLTPGFITDIAGFLFLIPYTRNFLKTYLREILKNRITTYKKETTVIIDE